MKLLWNDNADDVPIICGLIICWICILVVVWKLWQS